MSEAEDNAGATARERSTVEFPYADLDEGVSVVRAIHQSGGVPMARDQIAARMNQKPTSGAFVTKISAARMFGLIEILSGSGKIQVTALGHEVIAPDEGRQRTARAEAFLNVELYKKLYDEFRNRHLPPRPHGLDQAMVAMGVAVKQRTNARYAFDRSAKQAGYFENGNDRLVAPVAIAPRPTITTPATEAAAALAKEPPPAPPEPERALDGVILALIDKLPEKGPFPAEKRQAWLTMMAMAFDMAYGLSEVPVVVPPGGRAPTILGGAPADVIGMRKEVEAGAQPHSMRRGERAMDLDEPKGGFPTRNAPDKDDDEVPF